MKTERMEKLIFRLGARVGDNLLSLTKGRGGNGIDTGRRGGIIMFQVNLYSYTHNYF